jgi:hypothetical protein
MECNSFNNTLKIKMGYPQHIPYILNTKSSSQATNGEEAMNVE